MLLEAVISTGDAGDGTQFSAGDANLNLRFAFLLCFSFEGGGFRGGAGDVTQFSAGAAGDGTQFSAGANLCFFLLCFFGGFWGGVAATSL